MGRGMKANGLLLAVLLSLCGLYTAVADNSGFCKIVNCIKGTCNDTLTADLLSFIPRCQCDPGWTQPDIGIELSFLPCVIPNCTLDISCAKAAPKSAPSFMPPPSSSSSPCALSACGEGGSCQQTSNFTYVCHCNEGYENLLNVPPAPCVRQCSFGADCSKLGINIGAGASAPPPQEVNNNEGVGKDISSTIALQMVALCFLFIFG